MATEPSIDNVAYKLAIDSIKAKYGHCPFECDVFTEALTVYEASRQNPTPESFKGDSSTRKDEGTQHVPEVADSRPTSPANSSEILVVDEKALDEIADRLLDFYKLNKNKPRKDYWLDFARFAINLIDPYISTPEPVSSRDAGCVDPRTNNESNNNYLSMPVAPNPRTHPEQLVELALQNAATILANFKPEGERDKLDEWQACYAFCFKQLNDAVQEIRRLQSATTREIVGWQPIETAPKDGTDILVFTGDYCDVAHWVGWGENSDWFNGDVTFEATHWMPLPQPPEQGRRE